MARHRLRRYARPPIGNAIASTCTDGHAHDRCRVAPGPTDAYEERDPESFGDTRLERDRRADAVASPARAGVGPHASQGTTYMKASRRWSPAGGERVRAALLRVAVVDRECHAARGEPVLEHGDRWHLGDRAGPSERDANARTDNRRKRPGLAHARPKVQTSCLNGLVSLRAGHGHFFRARGHADSRFASARPPHPHRGRCFRSTEHLNRAVLGPIPRPRLDLAHRAHSGPKHDSHLCPDRVGVRCRSSHPHPQPRSRRAVVKETRRGGVLRDDEIEPTVGVEVGVRGASLIPIRDNARSSARQRR